MRQFSGNTGAYLESLLRELVKLPHETEWVEFKVNNVKPDEIGEYISALSNSAAREGKSSAYMVWGVSNASHEVVGTNFSPHSDRVGNEELENWLLRLLKPRINFRFHEFAVSRQNIVIL